MVVVRVHLDTDRTRTRVVSEGPPQETVTEPDPDWVAEWRFAAVPPPEVTPAQWRQRLREEVQAYVADALRRLQAPEGPAMPWEGQAP